MSGYAMLQLLPHRKAMPAQEHIIYIISAHMDSRGLSPCGRETADRIVSFAPIRQDPEGDTVGWAVFDDEADRLDMAALDGLGRCLTGQLPGPVYAVGVMGENDTRLLRLYRAGRAQDTYITTPGSLGRVGRWIACRGHAVRWRSLVPAEGSIGALSDAFVLGQDDAVTGFAAIRRELKLHDSCAYGFASVEDAGLEGVITLYFCAANHVRTHWYDRFLRPITGRRVEAGVSIRHIE